MIEARWIHVDEQPHPLGGDFVARYGKERDYAGLQPRILYKDSPDPKVTHWLLIPVYHPQQHDTEDGA